MDLPRGSADLMAMALRYTLGSLPYVTPVSLSGPTPCAAWDLATLLTHLSDSLAALQEALVTGCVSLDLAAAAQVIPADGLVAMLRVQAGRLLAASSAGRADRPVAIADRRLAGRQMAAAGALEIAVHGWDIAEACHCRRPIPAALAASILAVAPLVVTEVTRGAQFADPVAPGPQAAPGDRLVALLGRNPAASPPRCGQQSPRDVAGIGDSV
jgi:uncharacterized protein (TIGR03086 family)